MEISAEKDSTILKYLSKISLEFPEKMTQSEFDYDKTCRFESYISNRIRDEILTKEQRTKWKTLIGPEIPEADLAQLRREYVKRTAQWIKAPVTGGEK